MCANHGNREATTGCAACGKRLCSVCAVSASGVDFCEDCAPANAERVVHDEDYETIPIIDPAKGEKAGFGPRLTGWAIDAALFAGIVIVLALPIWAVTGSLNFMSRANVGSTAGYWIFRILLVLAVLIYNAIMTAMTGQTVGRRVAGVMVLNDKGFVLSLPSSILRTLMSVVSFLPLGLGFWWAIWDKNGETWHDKVVRTTAYRWEEVT